MENTPAFDAKQARESIRNLAAALISAQAMMPDASKDGTNPHFHSKYATLQSVRAAVTPHLNANGLVVVQGFEPASQPDLGVVIVTHMIHISGESLVSRLFLPASKKDPQGFGSAITYGRRYALAAICGIASDDDDDANDASRSYTPKPTSYTPPAAVATPPLATRVNPAQASAAPPANTVATGRKELGDSIMFKVGGSKEKAALILSAIIPGKVSPSQLTDEELAVAKLVVHADITLQSAESVSQTKAALQQTIKANTPVHMWTQQHVDAGWIAIRGPQNQPAPGHSAHNMAPDDCPF